MKSVFTFFIFYTLVISLHAQFTINSQYGNLTECDTMTRGIFIVWWENDEDFSADADELLDSMLTYRSACLNELGMEDPPNPVDGYYYNVYLHQGGGVFPEWWGNGQGTDSNGYPYLTLPIGAHNDWVNVGHETFHVFQYSANAPGFAYSGDSQWYIEASANWFAAIRNKTAPRNFVEAESLVKLPHVPLWLSYDNFPASYPQNWQRYVHQYAMALLLYYLSEETDTPDNLIVDGFYSGTSQLPQEYLFNQIGASNFRSHFIDWAAHMTNHFDFLPANQIAALENEWVDYADPADENEFIQTYIDEGSNGWYRPEGAEVTTAWSFNTYKLLNTSTDNYSFELKGDNTGSEGSEAYFQGQVLVVNSATGTSFYPLEMTNDIEGKLTLSLVPEDSEVYFIVASMPETFEGMSQTFSYEMKIEKGVMTGISETLQDISNTRHELARYNLLGQPILENEPGLQIIHYDDGSSEMIWEKERH